MAVLLSVLLGGLLLADIPFLYWVLGLGALLFGVLLLVRIDVAMIIALLVMRELGRRFEYLGNGTPYHPAGLMGLALIAGAGIFFLVNRIDFTRVRAFRFFAGFLAVCFLSLLWAGPYLMDGLTVTLRIVAGCAVFAVLVYKLDTVKKVKWVIVAVVAAMIWPTFDALLGVWQRGGLALNGADPLRIGDSSVGASLALALIMCLVFFWGAGTRSGRLIWGGLSAFFAVGLLFSYGRAGWISFVAGLIFVGLIQHRRLLVIIPVLLLLIVMLVPAISLRFADISPDRLDDRYSSTLAGRIQIWRAALEIFPEHPLLGVGSGTGRYRIAERSGGYASAIHNDYLSVLLETGAVGLILFLLWQGQWFLAVLGVHQHARTDEDRTLALAVLAVLVVSLVSRLTENLVLDASDLYPLSALVAAVLVLPRIRAEEEARRLGQVPSRGRHRE